MSLKAEQVTAPLAHHGEGPVWHEQWGGLRFVDMLAGEVVSVDLESGRDTRLHVGGVAAAIRPRSDGGMVVAVERGFALVDAGGGVRLLPELWSDSTVRMNDGDCDPDGRFYCGSMGYDFRTGAGSLYRLDSNGSVTTVFVGVTISNGLAWSGDGATAYYVDSPTQRIDAFDYSFERGLDNRRPMIGIDSRFGMPDGIAVDCEDNIWVALWGGSAVHSYSPSGELLETIELPVSQVTACTFGGAKLDELYITTSSEGVAAGTQPEAGAIFRAVTATVGRPPICFAG